MRSLSAQVEIGVRFNEVDSLTIVWHGHYLTYFEDAREAFGRKYGLGYLDIYNQGYVTPLVSIHCDYKRPLRYGDKAIVEAVYIDSKAAKIMMEYKVLNPDTQEILATGYSVQAFLTRDNFELSLTVPDFFETWKKRNGLL